MSFLFPFTFQSPVLQAWDSPMHGPDFEFDVGTLLQHAGLLVLAYVLALPVGWNRERAGNSAGLRTFPLVAVSTCAYLLLSWTAFGHEPQAQARVLEGLVTGIGFIGGGAILKSSNRVRGTATAASVWTTGAIGASVAFGRADIALLLSLVTFATLRFMGPIKETARHHRFQRHEPEETIED